MKVGDKVWIFDSNRRIYQDPQGNKLQSPWYRGHFEERYVVGETSKSWIISFSKDDSPTARYCRKIPKGDVSKCLYTSEEDIDRRCWIHDNGYQISQKVMYCNDYDKLQRIKAILEEGDA